MVIVYWRIYIVLTRHKNQIRGLQIQEVQQWVQNDDLSNFLRLRKSALGTFYVCIVFMICYLPSSILLFFPLAPPLSPISLKDAWPYAVTLVFLNSSLNPVIYCWKMGPIRRTLMDIMRDIFNRFTGGPSSSCEMITLRNNSHGGIIRVCMGIFTTALRNKKIRQILNKNTSPYFHSVSLVIWSLTLMNRAHLNELFISLKTSKWTTR